MKKVQVELLIWDWKDCVDADQLTSAVKRGMRFFRQADSGGDDMVLVCSSVKLTDKQAQDFCDVLFCTDSFECSGRTVAEAFEDAQEREEATIARDAEDDVVR